MNSILEARQDLDLGIVLTRDALAEGARICAKIEQENVARAMFKAAKDLDKKLRRKSYGELNKF